VYNYFRRTQCPQSTVGRGLVGASEVDVKAA
jgi:hypothetical protein